MRTVAFCEIDPYCRAVLRKHWPGVTCYDDVTTLTAARLAADGIICACDVADTGHACGASRWTGAECQPAQTGERQATKHRACRRDMVICGGFPCQDISTAGKGAGITGARSGLWSEYARIIGEVRPSYVIVENVAALLGRGIERVLGDLAALGFDAEWHCIPASAVGAPHRRDRVWIVANANGGRQQQRNKGKRSISEPDAGGDVADGDGGRQLQSQRLEREIRRRLGNGGEDVADADRGSLGRLTISWGQCDQWLVEPDVGRVAHGVPARVDRLRSLGNAVVPQIPEIIGRAIMNVQKADITKLVTTEY